MSSGRSAHNVLVAYPYMNRTCINELYKTSQEIEDFRFLLDSGAFTAFNTGKEINLDDYCRFIETLPFKPWHYFMLDVIGNPKATLKNYDVMLRRGFSPIPIYTHGEDLSMIDYFYEKSDLIGVGGLVGVPKNEMLNIIKTVMRHVSKRKSHLLGFTRLGYLKVLKPYSCDSSTWSNGARFGEIYLYHGKGVIKKYHKSYFKKKPDHEVLSLIGKHGIPAHKLTCNKIGFSGAKSASRQIGIQAWVFAALDFEKHLGTKLFLAGAGGGDIRQFREAYQYATA